MNTYVLICVLIINIYLNFKDVRKGVRDFEFEAENLMITRFFFFNFFKAQKQIKIRNLKKRNDFKIRIL